MKVIATIRRVVVSDIPVTIVTDDASSAIAEAQRAARALQIEDGDCAGLSADTQVLKIEDAASGQVLVQGREPAVSEIAPGFMEVVWKAQLRADDHDQAACLARILQADPASPMSVFQVTDSKGTSKSVNLQDAGALVH
jgi:hypothetical protein